MPETRVLRLSEMLSRRKGPPARRLVHTVFGLALRLFFRRIEVSGAELVPREEPLVFIANHPNGLVDPALMFCALPRRVSFLAKSTLWRVPVINRLVRAVEALPVYRRADAGEEVARNEATFARCQELLRRGRCIALFPEGVSHDATRLLPVKTGAARIALGALSVTNPEDQSPALEALKIIPVGLYYTAKTSFRSEALITCGAPLVVRPVTLDEHGEPPREAVRELSARMEEALRGVTLNVEDDAQMETVVRTEQLFSSIYETLNLRPSLAAEFELRRRFAEEFDPAGPNSSAQVAQLRARMSRYEEDLAAFGIVPENLSVLEHSRWEVFRHFLLRWALLALFLPLSLAGAVLHLPAYLLCNLCARLFQRHGIDSIAPTVKILAAVVLMPLTWLVFAGWLWWCFGWHWALAGLPLAVACGYAAVRSLEALYDMRGWFRASLLLVADRRRFLRLLLERRRLHRRIRALIGAKAPAAADDEKSPRKEESDGERFAVASTETSSPEQR